MKTIKRVSILLTLAVLISASVLSLRSFAAVRIEYIGADGNTSYSLSYSSAKNCGSMWGIALTNTIAADGTDDTLDGRIEVIGSVKLILCDGCTLTINGGIHVGPDSSISIYCQKGGTGKLIIPKSASKSAGIGGNYSENCGTVNIYGGNVEITVAESGAGIGGGYEGSGGNIYIYGGTVKAVSKNISAGIGGGMNGPGGNINIYGGTVTAKGGANSAGIGGSGNDGGEITITGGTVETKGGENGAGIGGGVDGSGGDITISGGTVNATGGDYGTGIGGGIRGSGGIITISGGTVTATGGSSGAGIGGGLSGASGDITISGGTVTAIGGQCGAGIGVGNGGGGGTINISGGNITATGYSNAAGIGGGFKGNGADVTITGGIVTAKSGGNNGQAIGHGDKASDSGKLSLDDEAKGKHVRVGIVTGKGGNENVNWADMSERESTCRSYKNTTVRVERCSPHKYDGGNCIYCGAQRKPASENTVRFTDAKGIEQYEEYCEFVTSKLNSWNDSGESVGWYAVKGNVTISSRVRVSGNVNLILCDGASLTVPKGIRVTGEDSLTFWAQSADKSTAGRLVVGGPDDHCAGIGGDDGESCGYVTVNGGNIGTAGGKYGAGIGGGDEGSGGKVTINGGSVEAKGNEGSAGIGGGDYGNGGTVLVTGGEVRAVGSVRSNTGQASPGIGAGRPKNDGSAPRSSGQIAITGGTVTAAAGKGDIPAQAIGVNSADAKSNGTGYLTLGDVCAYAADGAKTPAAASARGDTCRGIWVKLTSECPHIYEKNKCRFCRADVKPGDVDLDGKVTPLDAMILARYLAGWNGYTVNTYAADVDKDNDVTVKDAIILARHLAGWTDYKTLPHA